MATDQMVTLSLDLVNKILAYMSERPFREAAPFIQAIQQDAQKSLEAAARPSPQNGRMKSLEEVESGQKGLNG